MPFCCASPPVPRWQQHVNSLFPDYVSEKKFPPTVVAADASSDVLRLLESAEYQSRNVGDVTYYAATMPSKAVSMVESVVSHMHAGASQREVLIGFHALSSLVDAVPCDSILPLLSPLLWFVCTEYLSRAPTSAAVAAFHVSSAHLCSEWLARLPHDDGELSASQVEHMVTLLVDSLFSPTLAPSFHLRHDVDVALLQFHALKCLLVTSHLRAFSPSVCVPLILPVVLTFIRLRRGASPNTQSTLRSLGHSTKSLTGVQAALATFSVPNSSITPSTVLDLSLEVLSVFFSTRPVDFLTHVLNALDMAEWHQEEWIGTALRTIHTRTVDVLTGSTHSRSVSFVSRASFVGAVPHGSPRAATHSPADWLKANASALITWKLLQHARHTATGAPRESSVVQGPRASFGTTNSKADSKIVDVEMTPLKSSDTSSSTSSLLVLPAQVLRALVAYLRLDSSPLSSVFPISDALVGLSLAIQTSASLELRNTFLDLIPIISRLLPYSSLVHLVESLCTTAVSCGTSAPLLLQVISAASLCCSHAPAGDSSSHATALLSFAQAETTAVSTARTSATTRSVLYASLAFALCPMESSLTSPAPSGVDAEDISLTWSPSATLSSGFMRRVLSSSVTASLPSPRVDLSEVSTAFSSWVFSLVHAELSNSLTSSTPQTPALVVSTFHVWALSFWNLLNARTRRVECLEFALHCVVEVARSAGALASAHPYGIHVFINAVVLFIEHLFPVWKSAVDAVRPTTTVSSADILVEYSLEVGVRAVPSGAPVASVVKWDADELKAVFSRVPLFSSEYCLFAAPFSSVLARPPPASSSPLAAVEFKSAPTSFLSSSPFSASATSSPVLCRLTAPATASVSLGSFSSMSSAVAEEFPCVVLQFLSTVGASDPISSASKTPLEESEAPSADSDSLPFLLSGATVPSAVVVPVSVSSAAPLPLSVAESGSLLDYAVPKVASFDFYLSAEMES